MKILLMLWAIGLGECDKLDRTYLPPPGSVAAGGYPADLNLPLVFPKQNYPTTLESGNQISIDNNSLSLKYPDIALGIDREGPTTTFSKFSTNQRRIPITKYKAPSTTSYGLNQTNLSPVQTYTTVGPETTDFQEYSPTASFPDPNLSYDQYLIQQIVMPNKSSQSLFISRNPDTNVLNKKIGSTTLGIMASNSDLQNGKFQQIQQTPSLDSYKYTPEQLHVIEVTDSHAKFPSNSTTVIPQKNSNSKNPVDKYENDLDDIKIIETYSTQSAPQSTNSHNFNIPTKIEDTFLEPTAIDVVVPSSALFSIPISSNDNLGTPNTSQLQKFQAEGDKNAVIINYDNKLSSGSFAYSFDTSNGIHADESGTATDGVKAIGSYSYIGDDGKLYKVEYTADEYGFLPRGDHLPTAPPIPNAILKGIEEAEKNRKLGIDAGDDNGAYDDAKYGHRRYQGLMDRIPLDSYKKLLFNQPGKENGEQEEKKLPTNNGEVTDTTNYELDVKLNAPNKFKTDETYTSYTDDDDKFLAKPKDDNHSIRNNLFNSEEPKLNYQNENLPVTIAKNSETFMGIHSQKDYDGDNINKHHLRYGYTEPENTFNDNDGEVISIGISDETNPGEIHNKGTFAQTFANPNKSFQFESKNPTPDSKLLQNRDPIAITNNMNFIKMHGIGASFGAPLFYNKDLSGVKVEKEILPERVLTKLEQKYASTSSRPYYYQSPYIFDESDQHNNNYPASRGRMQYAGFTTPMSSESSTFPPSSRRTTYSNTIPTIYQKTSTLRPYITRRPTETILQESGYNERTPGMEQEDVRTSTKEPTFGDRIISRPGYRGNPSQSSKTQAGLFETDTKSPSFRTSSNPGDLGSQSLVEKVFGEDFTGPKQPERFDPQYGYYY